MFYVDPTFDEFKLDQDTKELEQRLCINDDDTKEENVWAHPEGEKLVGEQKAVEKNNLVENEDGQVIIIKFCLLALVKKIHLLRPSMV